MHHDPVAKIFFCSCAYSTYLLNSNEFVTKFFPFGSQTGKPWYKTLDKPDPAQSTLYLHPSAITYNVSIVSSIHIPFLSFPDVPSTSPAPKPYFSHPLSYLFDFTFSYLILWCCFWRLRNIYPQIKDCSQPQYLYKVAVLQSAFMIRLVLLSLVLPEQQMFISKHPKGLSEVVFFFMTELLLLFYGILGFGEGLRKFWLLSISINYTHAAVNYHNPFRCLKVDSWNILSSCMLLGLFPTKVVHFWEMFSCYIYQRK